MEEMFDVSEKDMITDMHVFSGSVKTDTLAFMQSANEHFGSREKPTKILSAQFAENLARGRQCDKLIAECGEPMVEMGIKYISQAIDSWGNIENILKGGEKDENNNRFSAC